MTELEIGLRGEKEMVVQHEDLASFAGPFQTLPTAVWLHRTGVEPW